MAQQANLSSLVPNGDTEGTTLKVNQKTGEVIYSSEEPVSERQIAQVGFNVKDGTLNFVRNNGDLVTVSGFLTLAQLGRGKQGPRGERGKNGKNGRIGREGKKGKEGCQGPMGAKGPIGTSGLDGDDGEVGIVGLFGCPGVPGQMGPSGLAGIVGFDGPMGLPGPSCIVGERGIAGPQPKEDVWYGEQEPSPEYFVWAIPAEQGTIVEPVDPVVEEMSGRVVGITSQLNRVVDSTFGGTITLNLSLFSGGKGPFTYKWEGLNNIFNDPAISVGNTGIDKVSLQIKALQNIDAGNSVEIAGQVKLTVRDTGTGDTLVISPVNFVFQGQNDDDPDEDDDGGGGGVIIGGGGGGCVDAESPVEMLDGSVRKVRNLQIGDYIRGYSMPGMIDESEPDWDKWTTDSTQGEIKAVQVRNAMLSNYRQHYLINDLRITTNHHMFVKQGSTWGWVFPQDVKVGDSVLRQDGSEIAVTVADLIQENLEVVVLDVEPYDNYFVGTTPILVHNIGNDSTLVKKN